MYSPDDTIVAIATPPGRGGLGVVRLSGPEAHRVALDLTGRIERLTPRHATFARTTAASGAADQVVLTYFEAPHSYTGEDVVEMSAHGSPVLLRALVGAAMAAGSRLAEPGEFTFRAYLNGRINLVQAEAVRDLIDAVTPLQARAAFDQLEGTLTDRIREIDTRLFDLTARLEASLDFPEEGYHFVDQVETARELDAIAAMLSDLLATTESAERIVVANKADLPPAWDVADVVPGALEISAKTGAGLDALRKALLGATTSSEPARDAPALTNLRHADLLDRARVAIERAREAASLGTPEEFVLADLHEARNRLEEVTGARTSDDVLNAIFARFCIGK